MSRLAANKFTASIGAKDEDLRVADVDEAQLASLEELLVKHGVLFFPSQHLADDERFHHSLGDLLGALAGIGLVVAGIAVLAASARVAAGSGETADPKFRRLRGGFSRLEGGPTPRLH